MDDRYAVYIQASNCVSTEIIKKRRKAVHCGLSCLNTDGVCGSVMKRMSLDGVPWGDLNADGVY
jgi:hypothetical protein